MHISNETLHQDLQVRTIREEVNQASTDYAKRLKIHPNIVATGLVTNPTQISRLKRKTPMDLIVASKEN